MRTPPPHPPVTPGAPASAHKLWGVVEGFYGRPWTPAQRESLCRWMPRNGLNTYFYAPKDDLKHRALWHLPYTQQEGKALRDLMARCDSLGVRFIYGIAPGLSTQRTPKEVESMLLRKVESVRRLGCRTFALLFDDIPTEGAAQYLKRYGSWVNAHVAWTQQVIRDLSQRETSARFLFCPTPYCGSFAGNVSENAYLKSIGRDLPDHVDILWTGADIIAPDLKREAIQTIGRVLRRPPTLWDNLFANDYDLRRLYLGPYAHRDPGIRAHVNGILINPNTEFRANAIAFDTFASFVRGSIRWSSEKAYGVALKNWRPEFKDCHDTLPTLKELRILTDCLHLPFQSGKAAKALLSDLTSALTLQTASGQKARSRVRAMAGVILKWHLRITELMDRELSYTLYRHVWELKEEMDLLLRYCNWVDSSSAAKSRFQSHFHQPGTYRGGFVAELQRQLILTEDGQFRPARPTPTEP